MKDSVSSGKAIKVSPDELIFDQTFKSSNTDKIDIEPKTKKLAPFESFTADVTVKITKALPSKTARHKETIFIKSDFFDQKVNVTIIPSMTSFTQSTTPRDSSLQNSQRLGQKSIRRENLREPALLKQRDYSPKFDQIQIQELEKELEDKSIKLIEMNTQLRKQEIEVQNAFSQLQIETTKRKELEERFDQQEAGPNPNKEYIDNVKQLLREREPNLEQLMDLTMRKERETQERKDAKILEILKIKDQRIEELQSKAVIQEAEFGKLAQSYQDSKRKINLLEAESQNQKEHIQNMMEEVDILQRQLASFEAGRMQQTIIQLEEQLNEAKQFSEKLQYEIQLSESGLNEKIQNEGYYQEAIERIREQIEQKDKRMTDMEKELQGERERKQRQEEHVQSLMQQINMLNKENMSERSVVAQKFKTDKESIDKVAKLQDDKSELIEALDEIKKDQQKEQEQLRYIYERLTSLNGINTQAKIKSDYKKRIVDQIEARMEEVATAFKQFDIENADLNTRLKRQQEELHEREKELKLQIKENKELSMKVNSKKKNQSVQTNIDMEEMDSVINDFDVIRNRALELEKENERMERDISKYQDKLQVNEKQLMKVNEELSLIIRHQRQPSTQSEIYQPMGSIHEQDEAVSRLNAKVTAMKISEDKMHQEITYLRNQAQTSSIDTDKSTLMSQGPRMANKRMIEFEEKLGEYQIIVLQQREKLIQLEETNSSLKQQLKEILRAKINEVQLLEQRIENLQEINSKFEQIFKKENLQIMSAYSKNTQEGASEFTLSGKSTAAETERMRQFAQQVELNNMDLKHAVEEVSIEKEQLVHECTLLKEELSNLQKELIVIRHDQQISHAGITLSQNSANEKGRLAIKVQEQRQKIKQLETLLQKQNSNEFEIENNGQISSYKSEELLKTNERLRKEHQQAILIVEDLKENYSSKLNEINEKYENSRQKLLSESLTMQRKYETLLSQVQYMEKKEIRLFGQLEETKQIYLQEQEEKEIKAKQSEELLFKKEEAINDLEREVKQKERTLQERQEQISVLIGTLENEHSQDENRQKVLNLSAELCSLKSIEAQQEKKINEFNHLLKKSEINNEKLKKLSVVEKERQKDIVLHLNKIENDNEILSKKVSDIDFQNEEKSRELNELKYRIERDEFQIQMKEETIVQLRDQIKRSEQLFKEEVERQRKEFCDKAVSQKQVQENINKTLPLKNAVSQLYLVIAEYIQRGIQNSEKVIIQEFEKLLMNASNTIEKLQQDIDKERIINCGLQNEYKAMYLSKVLLGKVESQSQKIQKVFLLYSQREESRSKQMQQGAFNSSKIIKEQDTKIGIIEKCMNELEEENINLKKDLINLKSKNEDLQTNLVCFQQELENQRQAMERKAEMKVDERYKSKNEIIRTYFDSHITKLLLSQNSQSDKCLDLGREICSLKIVINNLEQKCMYEQTERESLESAIHHYKEQIQQLEQKQSETSEKLNKQVIKTLQVEKSVKMEIDKKQQEKLQLEKEVLKSIQIIEEKAKENFILQEELTRKSLSINKRNDITQQNIESMGNEEKLIDANKRIGELQDRLMDIRGQNLQELEELRNQYQVEVADMKRQLQQEREQLEKMFKPGYAPGDLLELNQGLHAKLQELKQAYESMMQENIILRKKIENEKYNQQSHKNQIEAHRNALADLETTLMEVSGQNQQSSFQVPQTQIRNKQEESKRIQLKSGAKPKNKSQLHFNKEYHDSDGESHSKIIESSLNVSALTSVHMINPRQSLSLQRQSVIGNQKQFIMNPPQLVYAFTQSKLKEMMIRKKAEELILSEIELRNQLKQLTQKYREAESQLNINNRQKSQYAGQEYEMDETTRRILELEIENEDLKIQCAQDQVNKLDQQSKIDHSTNPRMEYPIQDYGILVEALITMCTKLAEVEASFNKNEFQDDQSKSLEEAQRLVIRSLLSKVIDEKKSVDIQYAPSEERDRKIWYLELLEQQVDHSDQTVANLQNFIKKLQIDIQGNLQSAAQIKAASMDLANNTKKAAEEINMLRHVSGLIRHDLQQMVGTRVQQKTLNKTINPFAETNKNQLNPNMMNDQLIQYNDQLTNQLSITEKVKNTLETEIVQLKIGQAQELQQLKNQLKQTVEQRNSLLQTNEELDEKIMNLEIHLDNLKNEINITQKYNEENLQALNQQEKEKDVIAKDKNATSKHLQKLQSDLHDWRKQTDENMKIKQKQVQDFTNQVITLTSERDRLKAENSMLRRNTKERKQNSNDDQQRVEQENQELQERLQNEVEDRKKEMEYWLTERATMREMIDQLESEKVELDIDQQDSTNKEELIKQVKKKSLLKIKQKKVEIKSKEKLIQDLKNEISKYKLSTTQLEQRTRDLNQNLQENEERMKYFSQKLKEVEFERDLVLAEKHNAITSNDLSAQQISVELNSLRECFAKLKIERDNLLYEINESRQKEVEWRQTVDKMNDDIQTMEKHLTGKEKDQSSQIRIIEAKNQSFLQDLKFLKSENEKLKLRVKESEDSFMDYEKKMHDEEMKQHEMKYQQEDTQRQINSLQKQLKGEDQMVTDLKEQILLNESQKIKEIQGLRIKLDEVKEANAQIIGLYENQLEAIKLRLSKEQKKPDQEVDQMFIIAQRDAVVKQLKKENQQMKTQLVKSKNKNKELKIQVENQENNALNVNQMKHSRLKQNKQQEEQIDKGILKLAQILSQQEGYKGLYEQLQQANEQYLKIAEMEASLSKSENWNMVLSQQLQEQQQVNEDFVRQIDSLQKSQFKENKLQKQSMNISEMSKQQKTELKSLQQELKQIKVEWISPTEAKSLQDQVKDMQQQLKIQKDEVIRKKEVINQLKSQREQTEVEANHILADMEGLKDDNIKLQKLIKENNKNQQALKELKSTNDYLKTTEKRLKDEVNQLNEKMRLMKQDVLRKEQIIKDLKDRIDIVQDEVNGSKDRSRDVEKFREQAKKFKLEIEIKENQIRAMKQRMEHTEQELEQAKQNNNQTAMITSQCNQVEKISKVKLKKYEGYLKKSLESLRKIGKGLTQVNLSNIKGQKKSGNDNPLMISDLDKEMFKDSVNILGVSMDELEEFMNPGQFSQQSNVTKENITFIAKLDKVLEFPDTLNVDLDQICNYCMKLINEIN